MEPEQTTNPSKLPKIFVTVMVIAFIATITYGALQVRTAMNIQKSTGVLMATASDSGALLSISQISHTAAVIGTGSATVRLAPGTYEVVASNNGIHTAAEVIISGGNTTHTSLTLKQPPAVRSVESVDFEGMDGLTNEGITNDQINQLEQYFFEFKPTANQVVVYDDTIKPGPHNPNAINPFTYTFVVYVDNASYIATVSVPNLSDISLKLVDTQTNKVVYNSATPQPGQ